MVALPWLTLILLSTTESSPGPTPAPCSSEPPLGGVSKVTPASCASPRHCLLRAGHRRRCCC